MKYSVRLGISTKCKSRTVTSGANRHVLTLTVRPMVRCVPNTHNSMTSRPPGAPNCNCVAFRNVSNNNNNLLGWLLIENGRKMKKQCIANHFTIFDKAVELNSNLRCTALTSYYSGVPWAPLCLKWSATTLFIEQIILTKNKRKY